MDLHILESILADLAQADYSGWLAFHNYNEPLANPRIFDEIRMTNESVPDAKLAIYTNGDLLTQSAYQQLVDLGVKELRITRYPRPSQIDYYGLEQLTDWISERQFLNKLTWLEDGENHRGAVLYTETSHPKIIAIAPNVGGYYDRGGIIEELSGKRRVAPCKLTSHSLSIDYLGRVKMCCNIVPDANGHAEYVLGDVREEPALEVWRSAKFNDLRKLHLQADWRASQLCATCTQNI
ncbi:hypothetical protein GXP64_00010 [Rhodovulum sulfidophilum]|nr:SPASM domain-containing protein [Rhodovulum sulfidophilum]NDK33273.1 hypothetical protein [Rhodovulum sulfidophilum]